MKVYRDSLVKMEYSGGDCYWVGGSSNLYIKPVFPGITQQSGQISIIPKPELRGFWGSSLIKPPFRVTSADVVIICPEQSSLTTYDP